MPNGNRLESWYDAEYLRAGTTENGSITSFSYYNGELLAESDSDGDTISRYILGYGVAAGWNYGKEGYHPYHLDEQNSTAYITGINGEIENHYQYDAFGVVRTHQEEIHNRILYTGQQYDQSSGQYYLRARYYNPVVGRFLQEDVYRGDGLNLYAYCHNNPVMYYDPSGYNQQSGCKGEDEGESGYVKVFNDKIQWTATHPKGTGQTYEVHQRNDIDWNKIRTGGSKNFIGKTNAEAAQRKGLAPQLNDGSFATLHHLGQDSRGGLAEASTRYHGVGKPGQDILHSQYGRNKPNPNHPINRSQFGYDTKEYWRWREQHR